MSSSSSTSQAGTDLSGEENFVLPPMAPQSAAAGFSTNLWIVIGIAGLGVVLLAVMLFKRK